MYTYWSVSKYVYLLGTINIYCISIHTLTYIFLLTSTCNINSQSPNDYPKLDIYILPSFWSVLTRVKSCVWCVGILSKKSQFPRCYPAKSSHNRCRLPLLWYPIFGLFQYYPSWPKGKYVSSTQHICEGTLWYVLVSCGILAMCCFILGYFSLCFRMFSSARISLGLFGYTWACFGIFLPDLVC